MSEFERAYDRRLARHALKSAVNVYDSNRAIYIGQLVNIHQEGLLLTGTTRFEEDCLYQVQLHLPSVINGRTVVPLGIDCLWARHTEGSSQCWAGFQIIDMSDEAFADVLALIETMTGAG